MCEEEENRNKQRCEVGEDQMQMQRGPRRKVGSVELGMTRLERTRDGWLVAKGIGQRSRRWIRLSIG